MEESKKDWMINDLEINNFKSIKHLNIKPGRVNVFIGKPNAGKSNLLEALTFLGMNAIVNKSISKDYIRYTDVPSLFYDQNYDNILSISSGNKSYVFEQDKTAASNLFNLKVFSKQSHFKDYISGNYHLGKTLIKDKHEASNTTGYALEYRTYQFDYEGTFTGGDGTPPANSNIRKYQFKYIPPSQNKDSIPYLKSDGSNIWSIVRHNSVLKEFSNNFFKEFSLDVLFDKRKNKFDIMKRNEDSYYLIDFSMTPDTFQRMLYYLAAIESNKNAVILFEEPEAQSYPPYIQMLADRIVDDRNNQYFITTHSPFIVEKMLERAGNDDEGIKFFITYFEDYQTKVHELTKKEIVHIITNGIDIFFNTKAFEK